jgi:hypothetical protein
MRSQTISPLYYDASVREGTLVVAGWAGRAVSQFITFDQPLNARTGQFKFSDEGDLVDGQLGGPTRYPQVIGRAIVSAMPTHRLRLTIDGTASSHVEQAIAPEVQLQGITGSDGRRYSTLDAASFDTRELTLDALASFSITDRWKAGLQSTNLLDRRADRPGSVLIPYLAEGRRVLFSLTYGY